MKDQVMGEGTMERRAFQLSEVRADGEGQPVIEGYAAVYGQESEVMWNWVEIIESGFFEGALEGDVRSLWNHNTDYVLGRTKNSTLELGDDEHGLHIRVNPPPTQWGRDAVTSIQRGDVDQMSFAFEVKEKGDRWFERDDGIVVRVLKRGGCERLYEVSPVTFPAYPQTSVAVRSRYDEFVQSQRAEGGSDPQDIAGIEGQRALEEEKGKARERLALRNRKRILEIKSKF